MLLPHAKPHRKCTKLIIMPGVLADNHGVKVHSLLGNCCKNSTSHLHNVKVTSILLPTETSLSGRFLIQSRPGQVDVPLPPDLEMKAGGHTKDMGTEGQALSANSDQSPFTSPPHPCTPARPWS